MIRVLEFTNLLVNGIIEVCLGLAGGAEIPGRSMVPRSSRRKDKQGRWKLDGTALVLLVN